MPFGDHWLPDIKRGQARDPRTPEALRHDHVVRPASTQDIEKEGAEPERVDSAQAHDVDPINGLALNRPSKAGCHERHVVPGRGQVARVLPHRHVAAGRGWVVPVACGEEQDLKS